MAQKDEGIRQTPRRQARIVRRKTLVLRGLRDVLYLRYNNSINNDSNICREVRHRYVEPPIALVVDTVLMII